MSFFRISILVVITLVVGLLFFYISLPNIASNTLSDKMQVAVTIDDIAVSPNSITVTDLKIANPENSRLPEAFSARTIEVNAPIFNLLKNNTIIDEITIDNIYLSIEFGSLSNPKGNWATILENLPKGSPDSQKSIHIKKLILTNITIDLFTPLTGQKVERAKPITRLELTDISSDGGGTMDDLLPLILSQTIPVILKRKSVQNFVPASHPLDSLLSPFKSGWF